jgi:uncharacterized protein YbaR (Trm112 family)
MKHYLHYVGSRLYPKETFIKEAKDIGVNRCLLPRILKKLKWGDKILLGTYIPKTISPTILVCPICKTELQTFPLEVDNTYIDIFGCPTCNKEVKEAEGLTVKVDRRKNRTEGQADVFGYFAISGININASDALKKNLYSKLNIIETAEPNTKVQRQCGSYTISLSLTVTNTIEDIINKAEDLAREMNEKIKIFTGGSFYNVNVVISPVNFSRTVVVVDLEETLKQENSKTTVNFIYNYEKRSYIKTHEKRGRPRKEKNG